MATMQEEIFQILPSFEDQAATAGPSDIVTLLKNALAEPIDHPVLTESIFPGDRVTILVQNGLPAARKTLESLVRVLEQNRIETENVLVVVSPGMKRAFDLVESRPADPETGTPMTWRMKSDNSESPLQFEVHAADDEQCASYLAANEQGNPVYVNRSLFDSDVILPLSCILPGRKHSDCLYPEFSIDETRGRYRGKQDSEHQRIAEAELANDSLGLFFSIELVCGPGKVIEDIVCGSRTRARQVAADRLEPLWHMDAEEDGDVVVTTIESADEDATWAQVVSAVNVAATVVPDGPIIVWSKLKEKPKGKITTACSAQFEGSVPDSLPTQLQHFASILCERPVYLKSELSSNVVEGLGLGYIESTESAQRILSTFSQPRLIRDGHMRSAQSTHSELSIAEHER